MLLPETFGPLPHPPKPLTVTARELIAKEFAPVRWIVPDVLPEGLSMVVAPPKIGKSWLALNFALATAAGGVALDCKAVEQGEVLYLALNFDPALAQWQLLGNAEDLQLNERGF